MKREKAHDLQEKGKKYVWHNMFRYSSGSYPLIIESADGIYVTDVDGNRYLEGMSGLWCVNVGYGREDLAEVAYNQIKEMTYCPLTKSHLPAIELAEKINQWLNEEYVVFFSNSGSEANETAFKIARQYHYQNHEAGRYKIISRYRAYHGSTFAALAATGQSHRKYRYEPLASGFLHIAPPDCYRCPAYKSKDSCNLECTNALEETVAWEDQNSIAGVIMEPIITGGGILVTHDDYFKKIEEICRRHGILFIVDEVICGFGRMGEYFGHMKYNVLPDIITMAKGISSGYLPLSATAVKKDIFDLFTKPGEYEHFRHINTYGGHPAACAVAIKNMEIIEEENLISNSQEMGSRFEGKVQDLYQNPYVGDIRCKGLLTGIELVEDKETKKPLEDNKVNQFMTECKKRGLLVGKNSDTVAGFNNIITIAPPLTISAKEIDFMAGVVKEAVETLG